VYLALEQTVLVEGKKHRHVRLARTDRPAFFIVEVDDKRYGVELTSKFDRSNPSFIVRVDGKPYKIDLRQSSNESTTIQVDGRTFTIKREKLIDVTPKTDSFQTLPMKETVMKLPLEEGAVIASMPGKVVAIKVKKDDKVKAEDVLCILEAMKMENEIVAHKDGVVREVLISEGASVNKGDSMFIVN
jgi:biotin carboxyl carrier protein